MPRPIRIDQGDLVSCARAVFLERGLQASTVDIAERAGVSESTLFKRFGNKQGLFHAVVALQLQEPGWLDGAMKGPGDVEERLTRLAEKGLEHFRVLVPLMMMAWSASAQGYLPPRFDEPLPPQVTEVRAVAKLFSAEARAGNLGAHDAQIAARLFLGALQNYAILVLMDRSRDELPLGHKAYARRAVKLLLDGLRPQASQGAAP